MANYTFKYVHTDTSLGVKFIFEKPNIESQRLSVWSVSEIRFVQL